MGVSCAYRAQYTTPCGVVKSIMVPTAYIIPVFEGIVFHCHHPGTIGSVATNLRVTVGVMHLAAYLIALFLKSLDQYGSITIFLKIHILPTLIGIGRDLVSDAQFLQPIQREPCPRVPRVSKHLKGHGLFHELVSLC
jgi:hypothetical protein